MPMPRGGRRKQRHLRLTALTAQAHRLAYRASRGMSACASGLPQPVTGSHPGEAR
jgi:hypothetical protein